MDMTYCLLLYLSSSNLLMEDYEPTIRVRALMYNYGDGASGNWI